jgi:hypothetical protein
MSIAAPPAPLADAEIRRFADRGYHVLPEFLDREAIAALKVEIDGMLTARSRPTDPYAPRVRSSWPFEHPAHGALTVEPRLLAAVRSLMGGDFTFHHLHTARHDPGCHGVSWHHDYEQCPQTNRSHLMVHVFFYLNGLNGTVGDLLLLPGSQRAVMDRNALGSCGTDDIPGSLVIDQLAPGTAVIVHSALLHARRPKPGGEGRARYFIDSSYCQAELRWPGYPGYAAMLERARSCGLERADHPRLFDSDRYFDSRAASERMQDLARGSLIERL